MKLPKGFHVEVKGRLTDPVRITMSSEKDNSIRWALAFPDNYKKECQRLGKIALSPEQLEECLSK